MDSGPRGQSRSLFTTTWGNYRNLTSPTNSAEEAENRGLSLVFVFLFGGLLGLGGGVLGGAGERGHVFAELLLDGRELCWARGALDLDVFEERVSAGGSRVVVPQEGDEALPVDLALAVEEEVAEGAA